jgi:predicted ester cyclase
MSTEENKVIVRRILEEGLVQGNFALLDELVAENVVDHAMPPGYPPGREGVKEFFAMYHAAFPDLQIAIDTELAEADKVSLYTQMEGTQKGPFLGYPPTGKHAKWDEIHIFRCAKGQLVEHWGIADKLSLLQQLGVMPSQDETEAN